MTRIFVAFLNLINEAIKDRHNESNGRFSKNQAGDASCID